MVIDLRKAQLLPPTIQNFREYQGAVNDASIQILGYVFQARELLMNVYSCSGKQIDPNGNDYYDVTYQLISAPVNNDGTRGNWDIDVVDAGWKQKVGGKLIDCTVGKQLNERPVTPQLLNGQGVQKAVGAAPTYLQNRIKKEKDFSVFTFPGVYP